MESHSSDRTGKPYIAIVVGDAARRAQAASSLGSFYHFAEYADMSRAMAGCRAHMPQLALVSDELATSSGFDFVRMLRLNPDLASIPILMVVRMDDKAAREAVAQCGADACLADSYSRSGLVTAVSGLLNRRVENEWKGLQPVQRQALTGSLALFNGIADVITTGQPVLYQAIGAACGPLVDAVANHDFRGMLDGVRNHDNYTFAHSMRVATYLALFGFNLSLPKEEQIILASGGLLHDVGKMSIPHEVLNKSGRLTAAEFELMKGHVTASVTYLSACPDLPKGIITIAAQHHEKLDGTGYPMKLSGNKLNRLARMASIIDVFSALTDRRVYKPPMDPETALNLMVREMGAHLDIKLLGLFRQMLLDATSDAPQAVSDPA